MPSRLSVQKQQIYLRDYLGHESVQATNIYARADSKLKRGIVKKKIET